MSTLRLNPVLPVLVLLLAPCGCDNRGNKQPSPLDKNAIPAAEGERAAHEKAQAHREAVESKEAAEFVKQEEDRKAQKVADNMRSLAANAENEHRKAVEHEKASQFRQARERRLAVEHEKASQFRQARERRLAVEFEKASQFRQARERRLAVEFEKARQYLMSKPNVPAKSLEKTASVTDVYLKEELSKNGLEYCGALVIDRHAGEKDTFNDISGAEAVPGGFPGEMILAKEDGTLLHVWIEVKNSRLTGIKRLSTSKLLLDRVESLAWTGEFLMVTRDNDPQIYRCKWPPNAKSEVKMDTLTTVGLDPKYKCGPGSRDNGIEAMAHLGDGKCLCIAEIEPEESSPDDRKYRSRSRKAWIVDVKDGSNRQVNYLSPKQDFDPGAATTTSNGDVIIVHKRYSRSEGSNTLCITRLRADTVKRLLSGGKVVDPGEPVLISKSPTELTKSFLDNNEAITHFSVGGNNYIVLVSDNNGSWNHFEQKVIVTLFRLVD